MPFSWHPDEPPPSIEAHSKEKLDVLRRYLRACFDRLNVNPQREEFKLDLVDGFAGGGTFLDGGEILSGTPLIMLEESEAARSRLNRSRTKPLHFDCKPDCCINRKIPYPPIKPGAGSGKVRHSHEACARKSG